LWGGEADYREAAGAEVSLLQGAAGGIFMGGRLRLGELRNFLHLAT